MAIVFQTSTALDSRLRQLALVMIRLTADHPKQAPKCLRHKDFYSQKQSYSWGHQIHREPNPIKGEVAVVLRVTSQGVNLKAKKILVGRARLIEEKGPLVRCIECVAHATRRDTGGPRDAVEGRAVEAASQAGSAD